MGASHDGPRVVVLAGPNQLLLIGVKQVLEATDRFKVVSQAHASELALTLARQLRPDYVVLDGTARSHKSSRGGIVDTMHGLVQLSKPPGVLAVVAPDQFGLVEELRRAGCRAGVSTRSADAVVRALDMLSLGKEFFPEWRAGQRRRGHAQGDSGLSSLLKGLNRNEFRILALMGRGHRSKEIAARLSLAEGTVNNYRASIRSKLGVRTHAEIREAARARGLLDPLDGHGAGGERGRGGIGPEHGKRTVR